jgi:hypothetical protein
MNVDPANYCFQSLLYYDHKLEHEGSPSLGYLVSLTDSPDHKISETLPAKRILTWLYEMEDQSRNAEHLKAGEEFFDRYFDGGFYPQTPCMLVKKWSPIEAMLLRKMTPQVLDREPKFRAVATGIWEPQRDFEANEIGLAKTDEELFWAIIKTVSQLAVERKMWINVICKPGWHYESAINSLPSWPTEEAAKAGRVLWKRTVRG